MSTPKVIEKITSGVKPEQGWYYSESPGPCKCGNQELVVIQTTEKEKNYPARTAIHCPKCGDTGEDTCHGITHACRRWNWYEHEIQ